jgi:hypothetical protein
MLTRLILATLDFDSTTVRLLAQDTIDLNSNSKNINKPKFTYT